MAIGKKTFEPLLLLLAIIMIFTGSILALGFGYAAWQVLYHPEKVSMVTYLINEVAATQDVPALTATVDGRVAEYKLSRSMKAFGLCYLFITGIGILVSIARGLSDIGVHIIKALWPAPVVQKRAATSKSMPPQSTPPRSEPPDSSRTAV